MIYPRVAFVVALFALTALGPAHAQKAGTPTPQLATPRINVGAVTIEAQPFFVAAPPSTRKAEASRPHARHDRCWNECRARCAANDLKCPQSCALVCE